MRLLTFLLFDSKRALSGAVGKHTRGISASSYLADKAPGLPGGEGIEAAEWSLEGMKSA